MIWSRVLLVAALCAAPSLSRASAPSPQPLWIGAAEAVVEAEAVEPTDALEEIDELLERCMALVEAAERAGEDDRAEVLLGYQVRVEALRVIAEEASEREAAALREGNERAARHQALKVASALGKARGALEDAEALAAGPPAQVVETAEDWLIPELWFGSPYGVDPGPSVVDVLDGEVGVQR